LIDQLRVKFYGQNWINYNYKFDPKSNIPGVDVMITIFWDFCQFSAKNLAFFSEIFA
jgi:hypothetical protein